MPNLPSCIGPRSQIDTWQQRARHAATVRQQRRRAVQQIEQERENINPFVNGRTPTEEENKLILMTALGLKQQAMVSKTKWTARSIAADVRHRHRSSSVAC
jgi:hypothetical protein